MNAAAARIPLAARAMWAITLARLAMIVFAAATALLMASDRADLVPDGLRKAFLTSIGQDAASFGSDEAWFVVRAMAVPGALLVAELYLMGKGILPIMRWVLGLDIILTLMRMSLPYGGIVMLLSFRRSAREFYGET